MTLASAPPRQPGVEPAAPSQATQHSPMASVARGALLLLSAQPITWAASAVGAIVTPRYLGDEALGVFVFCWAIAGLVGTFVTLGVPEYLVRHLAGRPAAVRAEGEAAVVSLVGAAALSAVVIALILPPLGFPLSKAPILVLSLGGMVVSVAQNVLLALLRAQERHARFAWLSAGGVVATNCGTVAVLVAGGGVEAYTATIVAAMAVTALLMWWCSGLTLGRAAVAPRLIAQLVRGGLPFLGWNVALRLRMELDRLLLGVMASAATVGWYAAAYRIIGVTVFIPTLITTPLLPALTRHAGDRAIFDQTLRRSIIAALTLTTPICAVIIGLAPAIPETLGWPATFDRSVPLIMILALQMPLIAVDMVMGTGLVALHRERPWLVVAVIGTAFNAAANVLLITYFERSAGNGAIGAAASTVATEVVMLVGALILMPAGIVDRSLVSAAARIVLVGICIVGAALGLIGVSLIAAIAAAAGAALIAAFALRVVRPADLRSIAVSGRRILSRRPAAG